MFFGSARVDSRERAERALQTLRARGDRDADEQYQLELTKSRKAVEWARFYEDARELARLLTEWSKTLHLRRTTASSSRPAAARESWRRPTAARGRPAARRSD